MFQFRSFFLFFLLLFGAIGAGAQKGLHTAPLFEGKVVAATNKVETIAKGQQIAVYRLSLFHSLRCTVGEEDLTTIDKMVRADASAAVEKEVELRSGRLSYALLRLVPQRNKNRYLCYQRNASGALVVYMEGTASLSHLKKIFSK